MAYIKINLFMPILYKSSSFRTYSYYIIYPVLICISIFFIYGLFSYSDFDFFSIVMILIFIYVLITSVESLLKLRYVEVTENYILIRTIKGIKTVDFKDVVSVYNLININGASIILWYRNIETQKMKVVLIRPEEKNPSPKVGFPLYSYGSSELGMTKFIKEKAIMENPDYLNKNNPRWFLFSINYK